MTLPCVVHSCVPLRLWPSKVAPTTGPSYPSCHSQVWHSSDHSPMRVTSEMAAYTRSGGAEMSREISSLLVTREVHYSRPAVSTRVNDLPVLQPPANHCRTSGRRVSAM